MSDLLKLRYPTVKAQSGSVVVVHDCVPRLWSMLVVAAWLLLAVSHDAVATTKEPLSIDIPPQALSTALKQFADENDLQVLYFAAAVRDVQTRGAAGELSTDEALSRLLAGTGLRYRFVNERTITIFAAGTDEQSDARGWQTGASDPAARNAEGGSAASARLEEIIVTAQRVSENLQVTPVSVTALTAALLEHLDIATTDEAVRSTPNLEFDQNGSASIVFIRGVGQSDSILTADPGVGIYIDGVYLPRTFGVLTDLMGVERVEVLRGPQGTLFGKNAIGGAINIITAAPDDAFHGVFAARAGSRGRLDAGASLNLPLVDDKWAASIVASQRSQDGYTHLTRLGTEAGDIDRQTARAKLRWRIVPGFDATLAVEYFRQREKGLAPQAADIGPADGLVALWNTYVGEPMGLPYDRRWLAPRHTSYGTSPQFDNLDVQGANLALSWTGESTQFKSITALRRIDNEQSTDTDSSPLPLGVNPYVQHSHTFSQELQFSQRSRDGRIDNVLGAFFLREHADDAQWVYVAQGLYDALLAAGEPELAAVTDITQYNSRKQIAKSYAVYDQATYHLTGKLGVTLGVRSTYEHKDDHLYVFYLNRGVVGVDRQVAQSWTAVTPKLSVQYQLTPSHFLYASAAEGFKSGGINGRPTADAMILPYGPEKLWSYEIGSKSQWLDDRLRVNLALFHMDYRDIQLQILSIAPGGAQLLTTGNGGDGRMNGAEAELTFKPHRLLALSASAGYNDFRYTRVDPDTGIDPDNKLPYMPTSTYNLAAQLDVPLAKGFGRLGLNASYSYRAKFYLDTGNVEEVAQPGYGLLSARVSWQAAVAPWSVYLYGKNLTDAYYRVYSVPELDTGWAPTAYGPPRELGLGLQISF